MTLIIHRCTVCAHPDLFHGTGNRCSHGTCGHGRHPLTPGPSEPLMTYGPTGAVITTLVQPGRRFTGFGRAPITTCSCADCWDVYRSITGTSVNA